MIEVTCHHCGKPFLTKNSPSRVATGRGKYCSRSCASIAIHTGLPKPKSRENAKFAHAACRGKKAHNAKTPVRIICGICNKAFEVPPYRADTKYCSRECANEGRRQLRGPEHPLFRKEERSCEWCGRVVLVKPAKLAEFRFCSRRCQGSYTSSIWPRTSSIELALQEELAARGITFNSEFGIGPFVVDLAFPDRKLAVEADGTYWHGSEKQQSKDRRKDAYLRKAGWEVVRLKEPEIRADVSACVDIIQSRLSLATSAQAHRE